MTILKICIDKYREVKHKRLQIDIKVDLSDRFDKTIKKLKLNKREGIETAMLLFLDTIDSKDYEVIYKKYKEHTGIK